MNHDTPVSPLPLQRLADIRPRVLSTAQLREHGVSTAAAGARCRPGGPWQQLLPGVCLLHPGPPTSEERLHGALLYAGRPPTREAGAVPAQPAPGRPHAPYAEAMITGLAALTLHRFSSAPPLLSLDRIDVLVPRTRRLRSAGFVRLVRGVGLPAPEQITGLPVAPVPRALADAVAQLADAGTVRLLLSEAVRGGHCEPAAVVRELSGARLLNLPHVVDAVDSLLAEGRAIAEDRLYRLVTEHGLPDPVWNVDLRLPGGPHLGGVDAYWPDHAVAVELDTRAPRQAPSRGDDTLWSECARRREHLERLGVTVVHLTPKKLRDTPEQQATVLRTALMASTDRDPAAYVVVLPR
ncbi:MULTISPECIES: hypothetical protein [Streptomyces]|uniref:hypothetical protein n=1 Tax=Streptomyces TaxID=1883 RepID=UPI001E3C8D1F|nr:MULTISPECIES: hypothetical protein [Streptomyces]UFQ15686.1 hypothetical protein J2N69_12145 [Streptomyces huasconensis]WCL85289.1 hypothetical protein PPN52_12155 [Streptomyces sp. JCM 35825]